MDAQANLSVNDRPTIKTQAVTPSMVAKNEKEYAEIQLNLARQNMLDHPHSKEAREQFEKANTFYYYVQDAYRIGARLKSLFRRSIFGK